MQAVQNYTYDSLNRLAAADEKPDGWADCTSDPTKCWTQTFTYDRYGNRRFDEGNTTMPESFSNPAVTNPTISTSNNRLTSSGYSYDSSGNMTADPQSRTFVYDAENKQVEVIDDSVTVGEYFYDGDGKRVKKVVPGTGETTIFVYDAAGKQIAEYSTIVEGSSTAKVAYLTNDHLGSPRINTDAIGNVTARHDYHPFGEEIATSQRTSGLGYTDDTVRKQFTGYERDGETNLDFSQARYYSSGTGRFSRPDTYSSRVVMIGGISLHLFSAQPQNWNVYSYCRGNPMKYIDPDGDHPVLAVLGAAASGAAIGAGFGAGFEIAKQKLWDGNEAIDWDKVGGSAIQGGIFGAVAGVTGGAGLALPIGRQVGSLLVANVVGGMINRGVSGGDPLNRSQIVIDAASGAGGGLIGGLAPTRYSNSFIYRDARYAIIRSEATEQFLISSPVPTLAQPLTGGPTVQNAIQQQLYYGGGERLFESGSRSAGKIGTQFALSFFLNNIEQTVHAPVVEGGPASNSSDVKIIDCGGGPGVTCRIVRVEYVK